MSSTNIQKSGDLIYEMEARHGVKIPEAYDNHNACKQSSELMNKLTWARL